MSEEKPLTGYAVAAEMLRQSEKLKAESSFAAPPCSVERTSRSVIERKLLTALEGDQVAILATKQDLEDMIAALGDYELTPCLPRWKAHRTRCKNLADGMRQLLREAFPPND